MSFTDLQGDVLAASNITLKDITNTIYDYKKAIDSLRDLPEAAKLTADVMSNNGKIVLVTDYDSDGINSAVVLYNAFKNIFEYDNVELLINRRREGNGFNKVLIKRVLDTHNVKPIDLLITADMGSSDKAAYDIFNKHNVKNIIVTDHHIIPTNNYPDNVAYLINNQRADNPFHVEICGCHIAFLLMLELHRVRVGRYNLKVFYELLPYVAMATVSDVMPMDENINRTVVKLGLNKINSIPSVLWLVLKNALSIKGLITARDISYLIAPLINTASRMGVEDLAFELLISTGIEETPTKARELMKYSTSRKSEQKAILNNLKRDIDPTTPAIVVSMDTPNAINGVIAAMLGFSYNKPTICFVTSSDGTLTGSARSVISDFNIKKMFDTIAKEDNSVLIRHGGHIAAAGCTIHADKLDIFRTKVNEYVKNYLETTTPVEPTIHRIKNTNINGLLAYQLEELAPYGKNFEHPVMRTTIKVKHIKAFPSGASIVFMNNDKITYRAYYNYNIRDGYNRENIEELVGVNVKLNFRFSLTSYATSINMNIDILNIGVNK